MNKILNLFVILLKIIPAVVLLTIYCWKFLPLFIPLLEVFLMNQTFRLGVGLVCLLVSLASLFISYRGRWLIALVGITSALLIGDALSHAGGSHRKPSAKSDAAYFTLYSQNVLSSSRPAEALMKIVADLAPDLVLLQEITLGEWERISPAIERMGYKSSTSINVSPNPELGFAIFSRLPLRNCRDEFLSGVDWSPVWPAQAFEFQFDGRWMRCLNVHLIPPHHGTGNPWIPHASQQAIALEQIHELIETASADRIPSLICGDFNQTPTSKILRPLKAGWIDAWETGGDGIGFSWHSAAPLFRIDYIFHSPEIITLACETVENDFSDHRGLFARMGLKGN